MKKVITIIALIITTASFAQMTVSDYKKTEYEPIGEYKLLGTLYVKIEKLGNVCRFEYKDESYQTRDVYNSFTFRYSDLDTLYGLLTNFEGVEKGSEKKVALEDGGTLIIEYGKTFGKMHAKIFHMSPSGTGAAVRYLTPKQLAKLFGKEEK